MSLRLAGCIITDDQGRILLLHRNTEKWNHWEVPGGKIEPNENEKTAASREVKEELGVDVVIQRLLGQKAFPEHDYTLHYSWYLAAIANGHAAVMETETFDEVRYFSLAEMKSISLSTGAATFVKQVETGDIKLSD